MLVSTSHTTSFIIHLNLSSFYLSAIAEN
ncbi:hypothetical protein S122051_0779 [Staphylococcus aureus subsp. aureus 122051]|nr:hypothetical protein Newbould305_0369 [Staphylococcus aureus subsp. aureus str. Newbould 305]EOR35348.1 hypothetical protein S103564_1102 [Staphylococcus aureus subsp. aureus 103564]EOR36624.1 hypothetical protein S091751_0060 [Staphylococcus aureus subsp. aureus 091751]EOR42908.1 hypothetical protein S122051_0779 [Staphylococcus aureus subsp. aureus 122051]EOR48270.1 hypothetical protein M140OLGA_1448 [Staphylococcus aureus subsp. aureus 112808A]